jgi:hypothetical protein
MSDLTLPLYRDLPELIEPRDCLSVIYTCLNAPACSKDVRGFEVEYSRENGWRKEVRP